MSSSQAVEPTNNSHQAMLQCPICCVPYDTTHREPKLLSCHHSFCLACLSELASKRTAFRCPEATCRRKTAVPKNGIQNLPTNFYVSQMRDFVVFAPSPGGKAKKKADKNNNDDKSDDEGDILQEGSQLCDKHMKQPLLFFCETCMVPICMNCTVLDHDKNGGHRISDIASAVKQHHEILQNKMLKMDDTMDKMNSGLRLLKRELSNLETTRETSQKHIEETFKQLALQLEKRKEDLLKKMTEIYSDRKEGILTQAQTFKRHCEKLSATKGKCQDILESNNPSDPIQAATNVTLMSKIDQLCQMPSSFTINNNSYVQFQYDKGLEKYIDSVGKLGEIQCDRPLPSMIKYEIPLCVAALKSTINIYVKSIKGAPLGNCPLSVRITDPEGEQLQSKLTSSKEQEGLYTVDVRPQTSGSHQISLSFLEYPIWGMAMDFDVQSNDPIQKITASSPDINKPTSVAICEANQNIYVADMGNKCVQIFNSVGKQLAQFKIGSNKATSYDIKINDATEELLCTKVGTGEAGQTLANTISVFTLTGERKHQFVNGELRKALFLAINSKGQIITTDTELNAFYIHSKEGVALKKIGNQGAGPGQFNFPSAVCIGKDDMILVSDTGNNRVQIFNKSGKFLHEFGRNVDTDTTLGKLLSPRGIAADNNHVVVADKLNRIQIFKYDGTLIGCIESLGDPIQEPYNMAITKEGYVYVADFKNNCVKKFRYK